MPSLRITALPILLLTLELCAQQGQSAPLGKPELSNSVTYTSTTDSTDFADFEQLHLSNGGSYSVLSRSKGYRMAWHVQVKDGECIVERGDGRTLQEFQENPPPGYSTLGEKPMGYGTQCVVVRMTQGKRSVQMDRWYFVAP